MLRVPRGEVEEPLRSLPAHRAYDARAVREREVDFALLLAVRDPVALHASVTRAASGQREVDRLRERSFPGPIAPTRIVRVPSEDPIRLRLELEHVLPGEGLEVGETELGDS